jgi:HEAT repeat protein
MPSLGDDRVVVGHINNLKHVQPAVRRQAVRALGQLPLEPGLALRQFSKAMADPDSQVRTTALQMLGRLGRGAVPVLCTALNHPDPKTRREAIWSLGRLASPGAEAIPALTAALHDTDRAVCLGAARVLGHMGNAAAPAVPELIGLLQGTDLVLSRLAAETLSKVGSPAVPALVHAIDSGDLSGRCEAVWALSRMGSEAAPAIPALAGVLRKHRSAPLAAIPPRDDAGGALEPTSPVCIKPRRGSEDEFLALTIRTLGEIGAPARGAIPELLRLIRTAYGTLRVLAEQALLRIDPGWEEAIGERKCVTRNQLFYPSDTAC